jgi:hypothetical protein
MITRRQAEMHNMQMEIMRRQMELQSLAGAAPEQRSNLQPGVFALRDKNVCRYKPARSSNFFINGISRSHIDVAVENDLKCKSRVLVALDGSFRLSPD